MDEGILKLTNAVYKILEFFPESEPLKNRAKDRALAILENLNSEDIDVLIGYLWLAKNQGWLSGSNFLIISNEYEKIKGGLKQKTQTSRPNQVTNPKPIKGKKMNDRQKKIVEFIEKNGKAQVMDIQTVLPNVTKRTIRRDLDQLLVQGKIERMGEFNQVFYRIKG